MKFRLYTKNDCPYCQLAIRLLTEHQKEFECYAMDQQPQLLNEIKKTYRWETVPVIGGFNDLKEYLNKGKQLLQG